MKKLILIFLIGCGGSGEYYEEYGYNAVNDVPLKDAAIAVADGSNDGYSILTDGATDAVSVDAVISNDAPIEAAKDAANIPDASNIKDVKDERTKSDCGKED